MRATMERAALIVAFFLAIWPCLAPAQTASPPEQQQPAFTSGELISAGQQFFGTVSRSLASLIEKAVGQWGLPNGYVLGEEAGGAFFGGLRYGEGMLYTKNAGRRCHHPPIPLLRRTTPNPNVQSAPSPTLARSTAAF